MSTKSVSFDEEKNTEHIISPKAPKKDKRKQDDKEKKKEKQEKKRRKLEAKAELDAEKPPPEEQESDSEDETSLKQVRARQAEAKPPKPEMPKLNEEDASIVNGWLLRVSEAIQYDYDYGPGKRKINKNITRKPKIRADADLFWDILRVKFEESTDVKAMIRHRGAKVVDHNAKITNSNDNHDTTNENDQLTTSDNSRLSTMLAWFQSTASSSSTTLQPLAPTTTLLTKQSIVVTTNPTTIITECAAQHHDDSVGIKKTDIKETVILSDKKEYTKWIEKFEGKCTEYRQSWYKDVLIIKTEEAQWKTKVQGKFLKESLHPLRLILMDGVTNLEQDKWDFPVEQKDCGETRSLTLDDVGKRIRFTDDNDAILLSIDHKNQATLSSNRTQKNSIPIDKLLLKEANNISYDQTKATQARCRLWESRLLILHMFNLALCSLKVGDEIWRRTKQLSKEVWQRCKISAIDLTKHEMQVKQTSGSSENRYSYLSWLGLYQPGIEFQGLIFVPIVPDFPSRHSLQLLSAAFGCYPLDDFWVEHE